MPWILTADAEALASAADEFLRSRPVEHTVELCPGGRRRGFVLFTTWPT
jgi:hypothetical protein